MSEYEVFGNIIRNLQILFDYGIDKLLIIIGLGYKIPVSRKGVPIKSSKPNPSSIHLTKSIGDHAKLQKTSS